MVDKWTHHPHTFGIHTGFGEELVTDDPQLEDKISRLKTRARPEERRMIVVAPPPMPPTAGGRAPSVRPQTAPAAGRRNQQELTMPPGSPRDNLPGSISAAVARREKNLRELRKKKERELAIMEKRSLLADENVQKRREDHQAAASKRVVAWGGKKESAHRKVESNDDNRLKVLHEQQERKKERLEEWRVRQEAEEARRREDHAKQQTAAAGRFSQGLKKREFRMQEAQIRMTERAGALAALKRAELEERRRIADEKAAETLIKRQQAEEASEKRIAQIKAIGDKKVAQIEAFRVKQKEEHTKKVQANAAIGVNGGREPTPRGGGGGSSTPRTPRGSGPSTTPRGKQFRNNGLEEIPVKCTLCEQEFSQLTGVTFLKAVGLQREQFGDDGLLKWCTRRGLVTMYQSASLCCFCCQFFAGNWN